MRIFVYSSLWDFKSSFTCRKKSFLNWYDVPTVTPLCIVAQQFSPAMQLAYPRRTDGGERHTDVDRKVFFGTAKREQHLIFVYDITLQLCYVASVM
jgi:hypothetical protein